ncbi:MAG: BTAD domain-containing putative transcriptional regulator [Microbacterium sp.]
MSIEVDLFGVLEARYEGDALTLRGDIPRAVLGRLAYSAGQQVTTDELVAAVWSSVPDNVLSTLRAHVSRLRSAGLGAALVGSRGGYLLDVPRSAVDLTRFVDAVASDSGAEGRAQRLARLIELVTLASQELLTGLDAFPFVRVLRAELSEQRRILQEDLGETALELGDQSLATAVLTEAVLRHPLHERPVRLLATSLARSARHSDAIETLDTFAERLLADNGLDASTRVAALRASIVRLDPAVVSPIRTGDTVQRVGVPIPLTRFIGRAADLSRLRAARHRERLITIVGPAGVGKTRTAVEMAREATTALDDEQYMVDLADVTDPDAVVGAIAAAVRATDLTTDAIVRRIGGVRALLILDNADHVIGALAVAVDALLARTDALRILVTSREPLRLADEHEVVLRPMSGDAADDGWRLFAERAVDARGGRGFDESEQDAARMLSAELDGIPLALELAAARLDILEIDEVRSGIGAGAGAGRHDSLRGAIGWSVALLDDEQRAMLVAVSRFAGPFTPEAVAGIAGIDEIRTREVLDALVGKSLVAVDRSGTGRRRLRVLESTKEFAAELDDSATLDAWRDRHREWFAQFVWERGPTLRTFSARDTMAVFDGFRADLATAMDSAVASGDRHAAMRLAGGLAHYSYLRGLLREGRERIDRALAIEGRLSEAEPVAALELANLAYQLGDAPAGFVAVAHAEQTGRQLGDDSVVAVALARAGFGRSMFGDLATGDALIGQARALLETAEPWARSEVEMATGQKLRAEGRFDEALAALTESNRIAASTGYTWMVTSARYILAKVLVDARRPKEAIRVAANAAEWARQNEDSAAALALVHAVAGACAYVERHEVGARLLGAVDEIGLRYDYSTAAAEGDEADRLRRTIAAGLPPGEFDREYRNGRRLGWDDVAQLIERLPQSGTRAVTV